MHVWACCLAEDRLFRCRNPGSFDFWKCWNIVQRQRRKCHQAPQHVNSRHFLGLLTCNLFTVPYTVSTTLMRHPIPHSNDLATPSSIRTRTYVLPRFCFWGQNFTTLHYSGCQPTGSSTVKLFSKFEYWFESALGTLSASRRAQGLP